MEKKAKKSTKAAKPAAQMPAQSKSMPAESGQSMEHMHDENCGC